MSSLFVTRSRSFPIVVRRQLWRAVVDQRHHHPLPSPSAEVAISRCSHRRQSAVSAVSRRCLCCRSLLSGSRSFPIVFPCQLSHAVVDQRRCHPSQSPSAEVAVSYHSHRCQSTVSAFYRCCLLLPYSLVGSRQPSNFLSVVDILPSIVHRCRASCRRRHRSSAAEPCLRHRHQQVP